ncbi:MAG: hypothetical protein MUE95_07715 [Cyclobacteriaceae bacterium]|jgi:hypothetical protein|nr:hypothetical protein [Cyclobacteriaceae bacterium]
MLIELSWLQRTPASVIGMMLFILLILAYNAGYRLRIWKKARGIPNVMEELGAINGALLGLLALLLAFTFGMANSRYDARRQSVTEETNAISTAILRTAIYPDSMRQVLREHLQQYLEARIEFYQVGMDVPKLIDAYLRADAIGKEVWAAAAAYARKDNITTRTSELIPALNAMLDIATTRRAVGESNIPDSILYFLIVLCLANAFLLGYDFKNRFDWVVIISFSVMLSATVYTIIDLDRPRTGLITLDAPNRKMVELRELFTE